MFFDQLKVPEKLVAYFGRARISKDKLLHPPACESGAETQKGLSEEELRSYIIDEVVTSDGVWLTPVCNAWPMGFEWSSYIAQATMLATVRAAGFNDDCLLIEERMIPASGSQSVAIATDDITSSNNRMRRSQLLKSRHCASWMRCGETSA